MLVAIYCTNKYCISRILPILALSFVSKVLTLRADKKSNGLSIAIIYVVL